MGPTGGGVFAVEDAAAGEVEIAGGMEAASESAGDIGNGGEGVAGAFVEESFCTGADGEEIALLAEDAAKNAVIRKSSDEWRRKLDIGAGARVPFVNRLVCLRHRRHSKVGVVWAEC